MEDHRLENGGKEAYQRIADHTYGDVWCLDGGVKQYPMETEQSACSRKPPQFTEWDLWQACEYEEEYCSEEHTIPGDVYLIQGDELSEKSCEAPEKYGKVKTDKSLSAWFALLYVRLLHDVLFFYDIWNNKFATTK